MVGIGQNAVSIKVCVEFELGIRGNFHGMPLIFIPSSVGHVTGIADLICDRFQSQPACGGQLVLPSGEVELLGAFNEEHVNGGEQYSEDTDDDHQFDQRHS